MKKVKRLLASTVLCTLALQGVVFAAGNGEAVSTVTLESIATNGSVPKIGVVSLVCFLEMI